MNLLAAAIDARECLKRLPSADGAYRATCLQQLDAAIAAGSTAETPYADLTDFERLAVDEAASLAITSLSADGALPGESSDDSNDAESDILTALARYVLTRRAKSAGTPRPHDADCARRAIGWAECTCSIGKAQAAEG